MRRRVILVRHGDDPPDDRVVSFLVVNGFEPVVRRPFAGDLLGEPDGEVTGSVIYGGRYAVYETGRFPFLKEEYRWIEACLRAGTPLLGICQGAQQIAFHLGAEVAPAPGNLCEFGYYPIHPAPQAADFLDAPLHVAQSHFHTFGLPEGAQRLASSDAFANQAFRYGTNVYGLQFHAEVTIAGFRRWQNSPVAMYGRPGAQSRNEQDRLMHSHDARQAEWFHAFLGKLFAGASESVCSEAEPFAGRVGA
jgi:GMP synthase (glutamine-hydrolysing)